MQIVLASGNRGKYAEIKEMLKTSGAELIFGGDMPSPLEVDETGTTYEENAMLKAEAWAKSTGLPAIADDSGLEARALGGMPGVHSARIVDGSDKDRTDWLLSELSGKEDRAAQFVCAIAVVFPDGHAPVTLTEYCCGRIAEAPSGTSGFGYDPVFIPDGYSKSFAELGDDIKNKISHRAKAVKGIAEMLGSVVQSYAVRSM